MEYDLNRPWLTLDPWQKEYIDTPIEQDCFLLNARQSGKTTAMSIKAVEESVKDLKEGEVILISSLTERQAQLMLLKSQIYAEALYPDKIAKGKDKPTMHKLMFKAGKLNKGILCYAAGEEGDSTRGYTLKKLMVDEGSRMGAAYFISATPTLSVSHGSMDIGSTPCGKKDKEGDETFFYKCSKDDHFKKFYVSAEDCPRHSKEFLQREKSRMTTLQYAQEYLALFLDEVTSFFSEKLINGCCVLKRRPFIDSSGKYFIGVDVAGMGGSENTFEIIKYIDKNHFEHVENKVEKSIFTTDTSRIVASLDSVYKFKQIGVDDGGVGFGVYSELMSMNSTRRKTVALNNASRIAGFNDETRKLLKTEMYFNLLAMMEKGEIKFLDDDEVRASFGSIQLEIVEVQGKSELSIWGSYSHIVEGLIRAAWLAKKSKALNLYAMSF